jgi:hypothetical protein
MIHVYVIVAVRRQIVRAAVARCHALGGQQNATTVRDDDAIAFITIWRRSCFGIMIFITHGWILKKERQSLAFLP